ncbi:hypothetical protein ACLOJK_030211 [Asimina triloba]
MEPEKSATAYGQRQLAINLQIPTVARLYASSVDLTHAAYRIKLSLLQFRITDLQLLSPFSQLILPFIRIFQLSLSPSCDDNGTRLLCCSLRLLLLGCCSRRLSSGWRFCAGALPVIRNGSGILPLLLSRPSFLLSPTFSLRTLAEEVDGEGITEEQRFEDEMIYLRSSLFNTKRD